MQKYQYHTEWIEVKDKTLKDARESAFKSGEVWDSFKELAQQMTHRQNAFAAEGWEVTAIAYVPARSGNCALVTYQRQM